VSADELAGLTRAVLAVEVAPVREVYAETVFKVRDLGVALSDRRAVKVMKLLAASAVLCGRSVAAPSDLWVLRYVWDRPEQIGPLKSLVRGVLESHPADGPAHPRAAAPEQVDGEELAGQLDAAERELSADGQSLKALARLRERVADLADRAAWVTDEEARKHLSEHAGRILQRLG
jgi:MoxR-like ATPase